MKQAALLLALVAVAGCGSAPPPPAALDTRSETCRTCRMVVSDPHFAAQIVASGEEPLFFDDLGCLSTYLKRERRSPDVVIYVADHRTGAWTEASSAVYTRPPGSSVTPMGGGTIAHADRASRDADPLAAGGLDVPWTRLAGPGDRQ
jgi:copper chaperone NosL